MFPSSIMFTSFDAGKEIVHVKACAMRRALFLCPTQQGPFSTTVETSPQTSFQLCIHFLLHSI